MIHEDLNFTLHVTADSLMVQVPDDHGVMPVVLARPVSFERLMQVVKQFHEFKVAVSDSDEAMILLVNRLFGLSKVEVKSKVDSFKIGWREARAPYTDADGLVVFRIFREGGGVGTRWSQSVFAGDPGDLKDAISSMLYRQRSFVWKEFVEGDVDDGRILFDPVSMEFPVAKSKRAKSTTVKVGSFGLRSSWYTVKTDDALSVCAQMIGDEAELLRVDRATKQFTRSGGVLVFGPVNGQVVVRVGLNDEGQHCGSLSERFGQVCYFENYRNSDVYRWERWVDGQPVRVWGSIETGIEEFGEQTAVEVALLADPFEVSEESVLEVAAAWSVDVDELTKLPVGTAAWIGAPRLT